MTTAIEEAPETIEATPETIELHGLIWTRTENVQPEYKSSNPDIGDFRVYQYPVGSNSEGKWLWWADFTKIGRDFEFKYLKTDACDIVDTREDAMVGCITARGFWQDEIKALMAKLGIGDYDTGFKDGQDALAKKVQEVLS